MTAWIFADLLDDGVVQYVGPTVLVQLRRVALEPDASGPRPRPSLRAMLPCWRLQMREQTASVAEKRNKEIKEKQRETESIF